MGQANDWLGGRLMEMCRACGAVLELGVQHDCPKKFTPQRSVPGPLTSRKHPDTSFAAAEKLLGKVDSVRRRVYYCILRNGSFGATAKEIVAATDLKWQTVTPRFADLRECNPPLIYDSGDKREGQIVWRVPELEKG